MPTIWVKVSTPCRMPAGIQVSWLDLVGCNANADQHSCRIKLTERFFLGQSNLSRKMLRSEVASGYPGSHEAFSGPELLHHAAKKNRKIKST